MLVHSVFGCWNQPPVLVGGSQPSGRGHKVMSLPPRCVSAPCGTELLLICPALRLGVDVGFLGFVDCAGVCCSPSMGLTLFKLYPISVMRSMFRILEKEVLFMLACSNMNSRWIILASCKAWSDSLHAWDMTWIL